MSLQKSSIAALVWRSRPFCAVLRPSQTIAAPAWSHKNHHEINKFDYMETTFKSVITKACTRAALNADLSTLTIWSLDTRFPRFHKQINYSLSA